MGYPLSGMRPLGPESQDLGASDPGSDEERAEPLVSLEEAARILGTSHQTIWRVLQLADVRPRRVTLGEKNVTAVTVKELNRVREVVLGGSGSGGVPQRATTLAAYAGARSESVWLKAAELEAENADLKFRVEVMEGQLAQAERVAKESSGLAGRARGEIKSVELERDRSEALREKLEADLRQAIVELRKATAELEDLRVRVAEAEDDRERLKKELELARTVEQAVQRRCDKLEEKLAAVPKHVARSRSKPG